MHPTDPKPRILAACAQFGLSLLLLSPVFLGYLTEMVSLIRLPEDSLSNGIILRIRFILINWGVVQIFRQWDSSIK